MNIGGLFGVFYGTLSNYMSKYKTTTIHLLKHWAGWLHNTDTRHTTITVLYLCAIIHCINKVEYWFFTTIES